MQRVLLYILDTGFHLYNYLLQYQLNPIRARTISLKKKRNQFTFWHAIYSQRSKQLLLQEQETNISFNVKEISVLSRVGSNRINTTWWNIWMLTPSLRFNIHSSFTGFKTVLDHRIWNSLFSTEEKEFIFYFAKMIKGVHPSKSHVQNLVTTKWWNL